MTKTVYASGDLDLGEGYSVDFHFGGQRLDALWLPGVPDTKTAARLFPAYVRARQGFLGKLASATGVNIATLDMINGGAE